MTGFARRSVYGALCALRVLLVAGVLAGSLVLHPSSALASRLATDRIDGIPLSRGSVPTSVAPDISARAGALVTADGRVLWSRSLRAQRPMASTTKIMTALLVMEHTTPTETITITRAASRVPYATGLRSGEKRSVRKLLELTLVASSNDAATALAIHVGGSVGGFSKMMNARAVKLGLRDTRYVNSHGLDATGHYSSAADLAVLMRAAMAQPEFKRIVGLRAVRLPAYRTRSARTLKSTDALLGQVEGLHGGKTGYTGDARYCYVASARRDGVSLSTVVLGSSSSSARFVSSARLLAWGFRHYRVRQLGSVTSTVGAVPISANPSMSVGVRCENTVSTPVFGPLGAVTRNVSLPTSVAVPVFAGQTLGVVRFIQGSSVIATVSAVATASRASAEETVGVVPVDGAADPEVPVRAAPSTATVAPYDPLRPVERVVILDSRVAAPVVEGQVLGQIVYTQDGRVLVTVPVVASRSIPLAG